MPALFPIRPKDPPRDSKAVHQALYLERKGKSSFGFGDFGERMGLMEVGEVSVMEEGVVSMGWMDGNSR